MPGRTSYADFVDSIIHRHPCLTSLAGFPRLPPSRPVFATRMHCVEFPKNRFEPIEGGGIADVSTYFRRIDAFLDPSVQQSSNSSGLVILVEDPGPCEMGSLGAMLDTNPLFFGGHLASSFERVERGTQSPFTASFLSQLATQEFINIHFKRVLDLRDEESFRGFAARLIMPGNIPRKARLTQALSGRQIGILGACVSVLRNRLSGGRWVCKFETPEISRYLSHVNDFVLIQYTANQGLILLDSTTREIDPSLDGRVDGLGIPSVRIPQTPQRIQVGNFTSMPSYSAFQKKEDPPIPRPVSVFRQLAEALEDSAMRETISVGSIISLFNLPCRMAMAEWVLYSLLMQAYAKHYEYSFNSLPRIIDNVKNQDFLELHRWRRRSKQSFYKLHLVEIFARHWQARENVTSSLSISTTSQGDLLLAPGKSGFWKYLAAAIPLSFAVLAFFKG